jgi:hypothetical protein
MALGIARRCNSLSTGSWVATATAQRSGYEKLPMNGASQRRFIRVQLLAPSALLSQKMAAPHHQLPKTELSLCILSSTGGYCLSSPDFKKRKKFILWRLI